MYKSPEGQMFALVGILPSIIYTNYWEELENQIVCFSKDKKDVISITNQELIREIQLLDEKNPTRMFKSYIYGEPKKLKETFLTFKENFESIGLKLNEIGQN